MIKMDRVFQSLNKRVTFTHVAIMGQCNAHDFRCVCLIVDVKKIRGEEMNG
jgi:hypothetical protein